MAAILNKSDIYKMRKITLTKRTTLIISSVCFCSPAMAAEFYGSMDYGVANTSGDDVINYALYDKTQSGNPFLPIGTQYGDSQSTALKLGFRLESPLFFEVSASQSKFQGVAADGNGASTACSLGSVMGLLDICHDDAKIAFTSKVENVDLVGGWEFSPDDKWKLRPFSGVRFNRLVDYRTVDYIMLLGASSTISDKTKFDNLGLIAGLTVDRDFSVFFLSTEFNYSYNVGKRTRSISEVVYTNEGTPYWVVSDKSSEHLAVKQWKARFSIGRRFEVSENSKLRISFGYTINVFNGFDTRDTNEAVGTTGYEPGSLGNGNARLTSRGADVMIGWNY